MFGAQGKTIEFFVNLAICCIALGACAAYVDFITSTLVGMHTHLSQTEARIVLLAPVIGLVMLRSFAFVSITSLIGDVAVIAGLVTTVVYGATHREGTDTLTDLPAVKWSGIGGFIGPTAFLFAIHFLMIPFAHSLREGSSFRQVVGVTYTGITLVNVLFGAVCFYLFGDSTQSNVVSNMSGEGSTQTYVMVVKGLLCVDLMFTIPPVFAAVRAVVEDSTMNLLPVAWIDRHDTFTRNTVRLALVGVVCLIAFCVPDFGNMVSLTGGVFMTLTGFVLPPLVYNKSSDIVFDAASHSAPLITTGSIYVPTDQRTPKHDQEYAGVPSEQAVVSVVVAPLGLAWRVLHWVIALFGCVLLVLSSYYTVDNF